MIMELQKELEGLEMEKDFVGLMKLSRLTHFSAGVWFVEELLYLVVFEMRLRLVADRAVGAVCLQEDLIFLEEHKLLLGYLIRF